jgi:PIN domain nuclease of toxin-antitoxin system
VRFLLDTHVLVWSVAKFERLSKRVRDIVVDRDNEILVSAASAWEIATKHRLGKFPEAATLLGDYHKNLDIAGFVGLPISLDHALAAGALPGAHKDPFDRMLIAQAQIDSLTVVTADPVFRNYDVSVLW